MRDYITVKASGAANPANGFFVKFVDPYNGKVIKTDYVASGGNATPPTAPTHEHLTFRYWKGSYQNVTRDTYIGAIYQVTDGCTYLFVDLASSTELTPKLYIYKDTTDEMVVDWGNGNTSSSTATGNINFIPTYVAAGKFKIKISCAGSFKLGNTGNISVFNDADDLCILKSAYLPASALFMPYSLGANYALESVIVSDGITTLSEGLFTNSSIVFAALPDSINAVTPSWFGYSNALEVALLPNGITNTSSFFSNCKNINHVELPASLQTLTSLYSGVCCNKINLPDSLVALGNYAIKDNFSLVELTIPANVTSMSGYQCISQCTSLQRLIMKPTTPPSLSSSAFDYSRKSMRIYVPDASLAAYKAATNWVAFAAQIFTISQLTN